ncbi:MAG: phasin family protein [Pikeienuella sp.]|uniref:phasin family protein n=1 Tax=Pikeienuella sp. TaxID=2831957 RepID=UPI00391DC42F
MADQMKNPFLDLFTKFGQDMNLPKPEIGNILDHHRKNLQALQEAAAIQSRGAQSMMDRQRAALEEALAEISEMVQEATKGGVDPANLMSRQAEFARKSFETTVKNATAMGEIMRESGTDSLDVLKTRVEAALSELQGKKG